MANTTTVTQSVNTTHYVYPSDYSGLYRLDFVASTTTELPTHDYPYYVYMGIGAFFAIWIVIGLLLIVKISQLKRRK